MATINAYKMDGLGNDFIIIDRRKNHVELSKDKIIELGKRSNIGFDQIIYIEKEIENLFPIKIFNSDGGEVEACGNGSRCIAYLLGEKNNSKSIKIKTSNLLPFFSIICLPFGLLPLPFWIYDLPPALKFL